MVYQTKYLLNGNEGCLLNWSWMRPISVQLRRFLEYLVLPTVVLVRVLNSYLLPILCTHLSYSYSRTFT